jgi:hypothetical protein
MLDERIDNEEGVIFDDVEIGSVEETIAPRV